VKNLRLGQLVVLYLVLTGLYMLLPGDLKPLQRLLNPILALLLVLIVVRSFQSLWKSS
jgi:hypothetical protein